MLIYSRDVEPELTLTKAPPQREIYARHQRQPDRTNFKQTLDRTIHPYVSES